jgi:hypothetical protein
VEIEVIEEAAVAEEVASEETEVASEVETEKVASEVETEKVATEAEVATEAVVVDQREKPLEKLNQQKLKNE